MLSMRKAVCLRTQTLVSLNNHVLVYNNGGNGEENNCPRAMITSIPYADIPRVVLGGVGGGVGVSSATRWGACLQGVSAHSAARAGGAPPTGPADARPPRSRSKTDEHRHQKAELPREEALPPSRDDDSRRGMEMAAGCGVTSGARTVVLLSLFDGLGAARYTRNSY